MNQLNDVIRFWGSHSLYFDELQLYLSKDKNMHIIVFLSSFILSVLAEYSHCRCLWLQRCASISEVIRQPNVLHISALTQQGIKRPQVIDNLQRSIAPFPISHDF